MMTDERLDAMVRHVESTHSDFGHMVMVIAHVYEMRDEIKRLRAELARYQTPNVDNIEVKP